MKYFTAEEARRIISHESVMLCSGHDNNPALEQARVLRQMARADKYCRQDPWWAATMGFILGRATGKREARQRLKGERVMP